MSISDCSSTGYPGLPDQHGHGSARGNQRDAPVRCDGVAPAQYYLASRGGRSNPLGQRAGRYVCETLPSSSPSWARRWKCFFFIFETIHCYCSFSYTGLIQGWMRCAARIRREICTAFLAGRFSWNHLRYLDINNRHSMRTRDMLRFKLYRFQRDSFHHIWKAFLNALCWELLVSYKHTRNLCH
jgi:hypothetical protein